MVLVGTKNLLHSPLSGLQFVPKLWLHQVAIKNRSSGGGTKIDNLEYLLKKFFKVTAGDRNPHFLSFLVFFNTSIDTTPYTRQ